MTLIDIPEELFDGIAAALMRQGLADVLVSRLLAASDGVQADGFYTVEEAAARLKVHRSTLKRLELRGELVPVRTGGVVRYRIADVLAFGAETDVA